LLAVHAELLVSGRSLREGVIARNVVTRQSRTETGFAIAYDQRENQIAALRSQ
jgi:hypothetical protein